MPRDYLKVKAVCPRIGIFAGATQLAHSRLNWLRLMKTLSVDFIKS